MKVKCKVKTEVVAAEVIRPCSCGKEPGGKLELKNDRIVLKSSGDEVCVCTACGEPVAYTFEADDLVGPVTILPAPKPVE